MPWLVVVLVVAGALRFYALDLTHFGTDQARAAYLAVEAARDLRLPAVGIPSSLGTLNPPAFVWLLMPAAAVSAHPLWLTGWIAALGVLAVAAVYALGRLMGDDRRALAGAALLACAPWAVQYSRSIWAQDTLPPLTTLCALTLLLGLRPGRRADAWLAASCALLALTLQVHLSAVAFAPAWGLALWAGRRVGMGRGLVVGGAAALVLFVPFLLHEAGTGWRNVGFGAGYAATPVPGLRDPLAWTLALLSPMGFEAWFLGQAGGFPSLLVLAPLALALVGGAVLESRHAARAEDRAGPLLLLAWLAFPLLFLWLLGGPTFPHYLIVSLPAQALLAARGFLALRHAGLALLALVLAANVWFFASFNRTLAAETGPRPGGDFRLTYRSTSRLVHDAVKTNPTLAQFWWARYILEHAPLPQQDGDGGQGQQ